MELSPVFIGQFAQCHQHFFVQHAGTAGSTRMPARVCSLIQVYADIEHRGAPLWSDIKLALIAGTGAETFFSLSELIGGDAEKWAR